MLDQTRYSEISSPRPVFWALVGIYGLFVLLGLVAAEVAHVEGHHVTGMDNQIVWGLPHVFAIFLIVAASGALNVASISSVFDKKDYKPLARFSAFVSIALLVGGLVILLLDLGRPDRLIVAITHYNFKSIFAWNIILYSGFVVIVGAYLWLMMERRMHGWVKPVGGIALAWRLILTTGTGSIFGFLVAREAYDTALLAPMFIVMSFSFGLAVSILLLVTLYWSDNRTIGSETLNRLRRLLGLFVMGVLYFVAVFHLTKLYGSQYHDVEAFLLINGGIYPLLFWLVQIGLGSLLPLVLIYAPQFRESTTALFIACKLVVLGGFAQLYVIIIGGQAYPLNIFPGYIVESSFYDGAINAYAPSMWEFMLGLGGLGLALVITTLGMRVLPILPENLADKSA